MSVNNPSRRSAHPAVAVLFFITSLVIFAIVSYTIISAAQQSSQAHQQAALKSNTTSLNQSVHQLTIKMGQLSDQIGVSNNRTYQIHLYNMLLQNASVLGALVNTTVNCGPGTSGLNFSQVISGNLSRPRPPNVPAPPPPINQTIHNLTVNISQTGRALGVANTSAGRQAIYVHYLHLLRELGAYLGASNTCVVVPKASHYIAFVGYYLPGCSPSTPNPGFGVDSLPANEVSTLQANPPQGCDVWAWMVASTTNASRALSGATGPSFTQDLFSLLFSGAGSGGGGGGGKGGGGGGGGNAYAAFRCLELQPYAFEFSYNFHANTSASCPLSEQINMTSNKTVAVIYAKTNPAFTWAESPLSNSSCTPSPSPAFGSYNVNRLANGSFTAYIPQYNKSNGMYNGSIALQVSGPGLANITGHGIIYSNKGNSTNYYANAGPGCFVANASATATSPTGEYGSSTSTSCTGASCQVTFNPGQYNINQFQGSFGGDKSGGFVSTLTFVSGVQVDYQRIPLNISQPYGIAVSPSGKLVYVADSNTSGYSVSNIGVINATSNRLVSAVYAGVGASEVVFSPSGATAYALNNACNVAVVNVSTQEVTNLIQYCRYGFGNHYLNGLAISPDGSLLYVINPENNVSVINTATDAVSVIPVVSYNTQGIAFSPNGKFAYVSAAAPYNGMNGSVVVINTSTSSVVSTIGVDYTPSSVAFSPSGDSAYVITGTSPGEYNEVSVINTSTSTVVNRIDLPYDLVNGAASQVAFSPSGKVAYLTNGFFGTCSNCADVYVINVTAGDVAQSILTNGNSTTSYGSTGVAFNTDGSMAYVANGDNTVSVIDVATGTVIARIK